MARSYTKSYTEIYSYPTIYILTPFPINRCHPLSPDDNYMSCVVCRVLYVVCYVVCCHYGNMHVVMMRMMVDGACDDARVCV